MSYVLNNVIFCLNVCIRNRKQYVLQSLHFLYPLLKYILWNKTLTCKNVEINEHTCVDLENTLSLPFLCLIMSTNRCQWVTVNEKLNGRARDREMGTWCHCGNPYCITNNNPMRQQACGSSFEPQSIQHKTGKHLPTPLWSPAFHLQSKSKTRGARELHQRAFW